MGTISFTDMLENEKKLKELKNSIKENLNSILHNPNKKENRSDLSPTYEISDYKELRNILLG